MGSLQTPNQPTQALAVAHFTLIWTIMTVRTMAAMAAWSPNPHTPINLTWQLVDPLTGDAWNQTSGVQPEGTWFPDLWFDLGMLIQGEINCYIQDRYFYVCPGYLKDKGHRKTCGGADDYFCAS